MYSDTSRNLSKTKQSLLKDRLSKLASSQLDVNKPTVIPKVEYDDTVPLSSMQQRMWYLDQLETMSGIHNVAQVYRIRGTLDAWSLEKALSIIAQRHESLRTIFKEKDGAPVQKILPEPQIALTTDRLIDVQQEDIDALLEQESTTPFVLSEPPLWRVLHLEVDADQHIVSFVFHHIIFDGWSLDLFMQELTAAYTASLQNQTVDLPPLPLQYADYAVWQQNRLSSPQVKDQLNYWLELYKQELAPIQIPTDFLRPAEQVFTGSSVSARLDKPLLDSLKELGRRHNATLFMVMLTAYFVLLHRYSRDKDLVIGIPIAGRVQPELENIIGYFVNTLAIRANTGDSSSVKELLAQVRERCLGAFSHQEIPFDLLVREIRPERDLSRTPVFQVFFSFETQVQHIKPVGLLTAKPIKNKVKLAQTDLSFWLNEDASGIHAELEYCTALFAEPTVQRMLSTYQTILKNIVQDSEQSISDICLLNDFERARLTNFNPAFVTNEKSKSLAQAVAEHAAQNADAIAAISGDHTISYAELDRRSNQLAYYLRNLGVGRNALVGICVNRSIEMLVGLLGILKAGGAYVPLDPDYPDERLLYMLETAEIQILLTEAALNDTCPEHICKRVCIDQDWTDISNAPADNSDVPLAANDLAYVIFTSGSTGKPKGVKVPHGAMMNFLYSMAHEPGLEKTDTLLSVTTLSFDIAVLELFLPLLVGGTTVIADRDAVTDGQTLASLIAEHNVTVMQATPSTWRLLLLSGWPGSRAFKALCGGEAFPRDLVQDLVDKAGEVWNMYGPTETTVWSTCYRVADPHQAILIGKPIANTQCYVLDAARQLLPIGVPGELYIGGDGVTAGYLDREDLTAECFVGDPYSGEPDQSLYRTGDLVRWREDGNLEYLHRLDHQVKVRGYRIELEEIEAVLVSHASLKQCVVEVREYRPGDQRLIAYIVLIPGAELTVTEMRQQARAQLPDYMVPQHLVELDTLPLTPNGKVDRKALPALSETLTTGEQQLVEPETEAEVYLASVWKKELGETRISVHDNFFDIGGHSLLAAQIVVRIKSERGSDIPLRAMIVNTLGQLASKYLEFAGDLELPSTNERVHSVNSKQSMFTKIKNVFDSRN